MTTRAKFTNRVRERRVGALKRLASPGKPESEKQNPSRAHEREVLAEKVSSGWIAPRRRG